MCRRAVLLSVATLAVDCSCHPLLSAGDPDHDELGLVAPGPGCHGGLIRWRPWYLLEAD